MYTHRRLTPKTCFNMTFFSEEIVKSHCSILHLRPFPLWHLEINYAFSTQTLFRIFLVSSLSNLSCFFSLSPLPGVERDGFGVYKRDDPRIGHHCCLVLGYGSDDRGSFTCWVLASASYLSDVLLCEGLFCLWRTFALFVKDFCFICEGLLFWRTLKFLEFSARLWCIYIWFW